MKGRGRDDIYEFFPFSLSGCSGPQGERSERRRIGGKKKGDDGKMRRGGEGLTFS